ncbi:hypothetical protein LshimejAT787_0409130 [Lyophyllum shimeji]|uniref:Uncharacterized protein n=1 Tax=Lyophyllum shimeji TaxID=47721 RepID=A0A9P3PM75_LYOSH|nr:hypothetical protein LshimejAT787_0409130 [Lyophyllum shimeji]
MDGLAKSGRVDPGFAYAAKKVDFWARPWAGKVPKSNSEPEWKNGIAPSTSTSSQELTGLVGKRKGVSRLWETLRSSRTSAQDAKWHTTARKNANQRHGLTIGLSAGLGKLDTSNCRHRLELADPGIIWSTLEHFVYVFFTRCSFDTV